MLRRLTALALSALTLQLNVRAIDLVCAKHEGSAAKVAEHSSSHEMAAESHAGHDATHKKQSCEIPASRDCCQAVTSCAMTLAISETSSSAAFISERELISAHLVVPASLIRAPEPPPPRL